MWKCKQCPEIVSTRYQLLKHYKLKHYHYGQRHSYHIFLPFEDVDVGAEREMEKVVLGIYAVQREGAEAADPLEDVGILVEECSVLQDLRDVANGFAALFGLIYCFNLSYPKDL